jgi:hypothetical protein
VSVELDGVATRDRSTKPTVQEWRLQRFRERLGDLFPIDLDAAGMQRKQFGKSVLRVLSLAVAKAALSLPDRRIVWALATHYADGQPMVTATLITCPSDDRDIQHLVQGWEFRSTPEDPLRIDLPALSTLERLTLEAQEDPVGVMGYELPRSEMGSNPMEVFRQFYRIYPHFSRVDL